MNMIQRYKVAEHLFEVKMAADSPIWARMIEPYGPFQVAVEEEVEEEEEEEEEKEEEKEGGECLFSLTVCDEVVIGDAKLVYSNKDSVEPGYIVLNVYKDEQNYYFEFIQPVSDKINGYLAISLDYKKASLSLVGSDVEQWFTFNTGMNFCFLLSTAQYDTVLVHASCVAYKDKAWLFLGKSGTGKSTHSRMWLAALTGSLLLNDDHPVIRITDGNVIAYGSPWSGKTRCYKNMQFPVGGIIRIVRAPYNKAQRLSIIGSYASLMPSCSGMIWEKELADGRDRTIQGIISAVPCYTMECLPNEDAAKVCSQAVMEV